MRSKLFTFLVLSLFSYKYSLSQQTNLRGLNSLTWLEGNWKGMDGNNPFYEIYHIKNDSTLLITSYEWNGKDSSKTSTSTLRRKNGTYYLGENDNWKVTNLSDSSVFMEPVFKAANIIFWKQRDQNTWEAILESKNGRKIYVMERVNHFSSK